MDLKSFWVFFRVGLTIVFRSKSLRQAKKFDKQGKVKERDAIVYDKAHNWSRELFDRILKGVNVTVHGLENVPRDRAVVFIGNHQGYLDIPLLLGFVDKQIAFIAKAEILKVPVLSAWMKLMQCTFLVRSSPRQSIEAMNEAIKNVEKGYSLVIFPEGHRSKGGPMKELKPGSFKLAYKSGAPIVPFTIDGSFRIFEENGIQPGDVTLTIHPPIYINGMDKEQQKEIPAKVQKIVASALPPAQKPLAIEQSPAE